MPISQQCTTEPFEFHSSYNAMHHSFELVIYKTVGKQDGPQIDYRVLILLIGHNLAVQFIYIRL